MKTPSESESVSHILRSSLPAANLMAVMETMAQRRDSMDDSIHLPNFPHMAWVNPSALPNDSNYALAKSPTRVHFNFIVLQLRHFCLPSGPPSMYYPLLTMLNLQWMECVIYCRTLGSDFNYEICFTFELRWAEIKTR